MVFLNVLNELKRLIESSPKIPMTSRVLVDEDRVLDFLDRIRAVFPEEIRQAKLVVQEREKVLVNTKVKANKIIEDAKYQILLKADESEVVKQAEKIAEEMVNNAENVACQITEGTYCYADDLVKGLEDYLYKVLTEIQQGRAELQDIKRETG